MRGSLAKQIRRAAVQVEEHTRAPDQPPAPWVAYGIRNPARPIRFTNKDTGKAELFEPTGTIALLPHSVRSFYKRIKANYIKARRRGAQA